MFFSFTASLVSSQKLGQREGAMATRWNQVVLPMGRVQDRVDAGVGGARCDGEGLIGIVTVHREPNAIEDCNRRLEHNEMHPGSWLAAVPVSARVGGVVERIVQRVEIAAHGDGRTRGVGNAVVAGRRRRRAVHLRHALLPRGEKLVHGDKCKERAYVTCGRFAQMNGAARLWASVQKAPLAEASGYNRLLAA